MRLDRSRPDASSQRGLFVRGVVPVGLERALTDLAAQEGTTFFSVMLAVFACAVVEAAGGLETGAELVVPTWFLGRREPETEQLVGNFDDLLLVRLRLAPDLTLRELVRHTRDTLLAAYEHEVPVVSLIEAMPEMVSMLGAPENTWIVFHLQAVPRVLGPPDGRPSRAIAADRPARPGDDQGDDGTELEEPELRHAFGAALDVSIRDGEGGALVVGSTFSADLFQAATARRLAARYLGLLRAGAASPDSALGDLVRGRPEVRPARAQ